MSASTAVSIGNFDGAHAGHLALVRAARAAVGESGRVVVLTFSPHPLTVLRPEIEFSRLSTLQQRRRWLGEAGADEVEVLHATEAFLNQTPEDFLRFVIERYHPQFVVEGPDFRFGRARAGSVQTLRELEERFDYRAIIVEPVEVALADQAMVIASSSVVRWLVQRGRVAGAAALLGRPYEMCGPVAPGDRRGRRLGVPTANLDHGEYQLPADGIYAGAASAPDGRWYPAAISVGTKPTFGRHARLCEAHLIGYSGDLERYGWTMRLRFMQWLRDQITYSGAEPLRLQLQRDLARTAEIAGEEAAVAPGRSDQVGAGSGL